MMRTPARAAIFTFLAVSALLLPLVATSVAANDDASPGPKGDGEQEGLYGRIPAYDKPVAGLDPGFYSKSCPDMEGIVARAVRKAVRDDYTLAASLIRLFFHDFAVKVRTPTTRGSI